jgi:hypothetical protein
VFEVDDRLGVGLAARLLEDVVLGDPADPYRAAAEGAPDRSRPARWGELFPPELGSDEWLAVQLQLLRRRRAQDEAFEAQLVVELASRRPAAPDSGAHPPGAAAADPDQPDEFFCDELALIWNCSPTSAALDHELARTLLERLPATWAAMADGLLDRARGRAIAAELGAPADGTDPAVIAAVEAAVLPRAAELSLRRLRELVRRELVARDAEAAERRRRLARDAVDVKVRSTGDGMAQVVSGHTGPTASAIRDAVDQLAWLRKKEDGDTRPIGVLRAEVLADLVLRPGDTSRPPVTADLTIDAPLAALRERLADRLRAAGEPAATATVDGQPITAAHLRELLAELDLLGVRPSPAGTVQVAITGRGGALLGTATFPELRLLAARGCAVHGFACDCEVLGVPPGVDRYRPSAAQRRFVTTRDRTCRHPGCANRAGWADLDHVVAHACGGQTTCTNLCCLCRRHHRLKTHARGWQFRMDPDGTLHVTTPGGVTRTTRPPALSPPGRDPDDPPPF